MLASSRDSTPRGYSAVEGGPGGTIGTMPNNVAKYVVIAIAASLLIALVMYAWISTP